jgi:hypothetical protein
MVLKELTIPLNHHVAADNRACKSKDSWFRPRNEYDEQRRAPRIYICAAYLNLPTESLP